MAKLSKGSQKINQNSLVVSEVFATPERQWDPAFDSKLIGNHAVLKNYALRLILRIFLKQITPSDLNAWTAQAVVAALTGSPPASKVGYYKDADDSAKLIKEWTYPEWQTFVKKFVASAETWSRKFWLMPPNDFTLLDIHLSNPKSFGGLSIYRPNVECQLEVQVLPWITTSHQTVEVVNLFSPSDFFRSHMGLYSSTDGAAVQKGSYATLTQINQHRQDTIVHEIGHAIGLPHVGQTRSLPQCNLAIAFNRALPEDGIPAIYKGGSNGSACYGSLATYGDADNIMGTGDKFAPENAKPWLDRLAVHVGMPLSTANWKISMGDIPPVLIKNM